MNVGIGRELYTAPFIWVSGDKCKISGGKCYDKFVVSEIGYDAQRNINRLAIKNRSTSKVVFTLGEEPKPKKLLCADCGKEIMPYRTAKKTYSPEEIAKLTSGVHGVALCWVCGGKRTAVKKLEVKDES